MGLSYTNIRSEKAKLACERNPDKHSQEAVGILKQATDKEYKYLFYKINNSQFNREPDYAFRCSTPMAQQAIDMGQDGQEHSLQGKEIYYNDCHSQCVIYKTFALFIYHPALQCTLRLATMEVKNESMHEITLFWELFYETPHDTQARDYNFNPKAIMVDENNANYGMIQLVFEVNFIKIKGGQM